MSIEVASIAFVLPQRPLVRGNPNAPIPRNGNRLPVIWQRKILEISNAEYTEDIAYEKHTIANHKIAIFIRQQKEYSL